MFSTKIVSDQNVIHMLSKLKSACTFVFGIFMLIECQTEMVFMIARNWFSLDISFFIGNSDAVNLNGNANYTIFLTYYCPLVTRIESFDISTPHVYQKHNHLLHAHQGLRWKGGKHKAILTGKSSTSTAFDRHTYPREQHAFHSCM